MPALCTFVASLAGKTVDRNSAGQVAATFVKALTQNNVELARSLVALEQLPRIDEWMSQHTPYTCPVKFLDLEGETMFVVGIFLKDKNVDNWGYVYVCAATGYRFELQNIDLKKTENGYQIIEWSEMCEKPGWNYALKCN